MAGDELSIEAVLDYYSDEVTDALAAALVTTDQFPEEALNELRASYTHLSRAHKHSDDANTYQKELGSAHRHLKRVCLDALKVSTLATARKAERAIDALTEDLSLPNDVYQRASQLRDRRKSISIHESKETTLGVIDEMKELFNEYDRFYQSLDDQFAGKSAAERRKIRRRNEIKKSAVWTVIGAIAGFAVGQIGGAILTPSAVADSPSEESTPTVERLPDAENE